MNSLILLASRVSLNELTRRILRLGGSWPLLALIALGSLASYPQAALAATLTITTTTLPVGYVGSVYSTTLGASGGSGKGYTWSISAGALPSGLSLASGVISGTPKAAGTTSFTIKVTDSAANSVTSPVSIKVNAALAVSTKTLATGYVGSAYSATLSATGGTGTGYTWSFSNGKLPAGLTLAAGVISGKPTTAATTAFTVKVTDSAAHSASANLSITVNATLAVSTKTLATGYVGSAYSATLSATGGTGTGYTWSFSNGKLPAGLTLAAGVISGKPTTAATTAFTVKVTDSAAHSATANLSITINAALAISTKTLATGYVGSAYSAALSATGGTAAGYTWSVSTGKLPAGLTLIAGEITGKPTTAATTAFTVKVTDSAAHSATANLSITVNAALAISTKTLATGYVGSAYSATLSATGGTGTGYTWSFSNGKLPAGLTLAAGVISGKPTTAATTAFTVKVTDSAAHSATANLSITINAALAISTKTLATGYVGSAYSAALSATGGTAAGYTWSVSTGKLPAGLTLIAGEITGKPTTAATTAFTVKVTDSAAHSATANLSITVNAALAISTKTLATGYVGSAYSAALSATGGTAAGYTWSVSTGKLPAGLTLIAGAITGKPTTAATTAFTVKVTDSAAHSATANLSITVNAALAISTKTLATGYVGSAYSAALSATGGTATGYTWSVSTGKLPAGLTLIAGAITGKPTTAATTAFTVKVTDSAAHSATANLSITVNAALAVSTKTLATGYLNLAYSATLAATGGTSTGYKWTIAKGTLPTGLALAAATGVISGKPTVKESNALIFTVTDSLAHTATASLAIVVNADLSITTSKLSVGYVGSKYSVALAAAGGSGTGESWSLLSGALPAGITLSSTGLLSGTPSASGPNTFSIEVKDSAANTAKATLTMTVDPGLAITSAPSLPVGYLDTRYSATLTVGGGSGTGYKWTATSKLPLGLTLTTTGVLSGTPAAVATSAIDVKVTDSASNAATAALTLRVNPIVATCTNDQQSTALVELQGVYTFEFSRFNLANGGRTWSIGSFNADGLGNILNGVMDTNGPEFQFPVQSTFTGSYTVGSDGRGQMDVTTAGSTQTNSFCFALDTIKLGTAKETAAHATVIEDDTTNNVVSGEFDHQITTPTLASVKGTWVVGLSGRVHNPIPGMLDLTRTVVGYITLDGAGNVTAGEVDQNQDTVATATTLGNQFTTKTKLTGTYTLPVASGTPTGRGTIHVTASTGISADFVFYPAGSSYMAILGSDPPDPPKGQIYPVTVGRGYKRIQTTFTDATGLIGSSVRSRYFLTNPGAINENVGVGIDVSVWDGKGNFTYSGDTNTDGVASTTSGSGTYTVDSNGRFAVMKGGVCSPCGYLIKTNAGLAIYDSTDGAFEALEYQAVPIGGPFEIAGLQGAYSVVSRWYILPNQVTLSGELVSNGSGNWTGTFDENQMGDTQVNLSTVETESATSTSGVNGRFLLYNNNGTSKSALYFINKNAALSIELNDPSGQTQPLNLFTHQ